MSDWQPTTDFRSQNFDNRGRGRGGRQQRGGRGRGRGQSSYQRNDQYSKPYENKKQYQKKERETGQSEVDKEQEKPKKREVTVKKEEPEEKKVDKQVVKEEEKKEEVKEEEELPEENLLEFLVAKNKKKKKKPEFEEAKVIKAEKGKDLEEEEKMQIGRINFVTSSLSKVNKGMINKRLSCYMNSVLQSLLASPHFYNMLIKIHENTSLELEESLLRDFVELALYFHPPAQLDKKSKYARPTVPTEQIFLRILDVFNPGRTNQDSQEFLSLCLDTLHEELKLLDFSTAEEEDKTKNGDWEQTGKGKTKVVVTKEAKQTSVIEEIFGGIFKQEFRVQSSKIVKASEDPFFMINLQFSGEQFIEDCLDRFFKPETIDDYKVEGKTVQAKMKRSIQKLPKVLILNVKRFIYKGKVIKMQEEVEFPFVLKIEKEWLDASVSREKQEEYRLFSVIEHRGPYAFKGHYVSYTLDQDNRWILFNDTKWSPFEKEDVPFQQAYILFYERI